MKTFISICTTLLFLLMACHATFADVVEDPVLYLDASDNPAHPKAWENLGTEGGELLAADKPMELEEGEIKIPALGIVQPDVKYYTTKESHSNLWRSATQKSTTVFRGLDIGIPL